MHRSLQQILRRAAALTVLVLSAIVLAYTAQARTRIVAGMVAHGPP